MIITKVISGRSKWQLITHRCQKVAKVRVEVQMKAGTKHISLYVIPVSTTAMLNVHKMYKIIFSKPISPPLQVEMCHWSSLAVVCLIYLFIYLSPQGRAKSFNRPGHWKAGFYVGLTCLQRRCSPPNESIWLRLLELSAVCSSWIMIAEKSGNIL